MPSFYPQYQYPQYYTPQGAAPQMQQLSGMIWVLGEAGAKSYLVAPNTTVALTVNGEIRPTSRAIYTPAAAEQYGNVTSTAIITVPRGCCFNLALRSVAASEDATVTPAPLINLQNANITINRIA